MRSATLSPVAGGRTQAGANRRCPRREVPCSAPWEKPEGKTLPVGPGATTAGRTQRSPSTWKGTYFGLQERGKHVNRGVSFSFRRVPSIWRSKGHSLTASNPFAK